MRQLSAVVTYPSFGEDDLAWIGSIRRSHDPQAALIRAHVTLVFPTAVPATVMVPEVGRALVGQCRFSVSFGTVAAVQEADSSYVFLLPSSGGDHITTLHDRMYAGSLRPYLRRDVAYVPHVTLARKGRHEECVELQNRLRDRRLSVAATIAQVDVVAVGTSAIETLAVFALP